MYALGRIYDAWPTFHGSALVIHPPLKGKSTVILPWRAFFKNFSPTKVGGNGSLFTPDPLLIAKGHNDLTRTHVWNAGGVILALHAQTTLFIFNNYTHTSNNPFSGALY